MARAAAKQIDPAANAAPTAGSSSARARATRSSSSKVCARAVTLAAL